MAGGFCLRVCCREGYEAINFKHGTHNNRDGTTVKLEIDEVIQHRPGEVRFLDSNTAHVVFIREVYPNTCSMERR